MCLGIQSTKSSQSIESIDFSPVLIILLDSIDLKV